MDKVGAIARFAVDLAMVFDAIRGADGVDPCCRTAGFPWRRGLPVESLRIAVLAGERVFRRYNERAFLAWLEKKGFCLSPLELPKAPYAAMLTMLHAEGAAAFDELLRGGGLRELAGQQDGDWPNVFRSARAILAVEYLQAARLRARLCAEMSEKMRHCDVLVAPNHSRVLVCTNLTGHPTLVLPIGRAGNGQPTVVGLTGKLHGEAALLSLAESWQAETDHHRARPNLSDRDP
ncbi:MAG: hypothetical protein Fur0037_19690 [Planctomycetota bacterium]